MSGFAKRLRDWWVNRPCYTEIFPFDSALVGITVTCEEAQKWDELQLKMIEEEWDRARKYATRPECV